MPLAPTFAKLRREAHFELPVTAASNKSSPTLASQPLQLSQEISPSDARHSPGRATPLPEMWIPDHSEALPENLLQLLMCLYVHSQQKGNASAPSDAERLATGKVITMYSTAGPGDAIVPPPLSPDTHRHHAPRQTWQHRRPPAPPQAMRAARLPITPAARAECRLQPTYVPARCQVKVADAR
jgi:hypothetical protein